jgi:RNA polymerase sigma factor (sigma-70 family)
MANAQLNQVVREIHRLAGHDPGDDLTDGQLLQQFTGGLEEPAFEALVRRHGPMVLGLCRRVLRDAHRAEDAFQATFVVLFRRARFLHGRTSLANWLYTIAYHVALRARADAARRRRQERQVFDMPRTQASPDHLWHDLQPVLDEELNRLPDKYRGPIVLCYLQGKTNEEAARLLHCPVGTVKGRMARARAMLRTRLARRGISVSTGLLAALLADKPAAAVPHALVQATVQTTVLLATGKATGLASPAVALAEGLLKAMFATRLKVATAVLAAVAVLGLSVGVASRQALAQAGGQAAEGAKPASATQAASPAPSRKATRTGVHPGAAQPAREAVSITIRVRGADGRAVAGAGVAAIAQTARAYQGKELNFTCLHAGYHEWGQLLTQGKTGADGRCRLTFARADMSHSYGDAQWVTVVATAPGHAVGWSFVHAKRDRVEAEVKLPAEQPLRGRLLDLQGQPAAGVKVYVVKAARQTGKEYTGLRLFEEEHGAAWWPPAATTGKDGWFTLRGVNRQMDVTAWPRDDRFALGDVNFIAGQKIEPLLTLAAARVIEGRVIYEDTKRPVPGVFVHAVAYPNKAVHNFWFTLRADRDGRFRVNHYRTERYDFRTSDLPGQPYFAINFINLDWPKSERKHFIEIALPRGVVQTGKVIDAGTGKPVAGAQLLYLPKLYNNPRVKDPMHTWTHQIGRAVTRSDGTFQIAVLPGPGHLDVHGPGGVNYVTHRLPQHEVFGHERMGGYWTTHEFVTLDVPETGRPPEVVARLQPAAAVQGMVVDQAGKPLTGAHMALVSLAADAHRQGLVSTVEVKDGQFNVTGCDPDDEYAVLFLNPKTHQCGLTTMEGKPARDRRLTVKLMPAGSARARFVDEKGKPAVQYPVIVRLKGVGPLHGRQGLMADQDSPFADAFTDAQGRAVMSDNLVPGLRYVLLQPDLKEVKEFEVRPGEKLDLGAIVVDPTK